MERGTCRGHQSSGWGSAKSDHQRTLNVSIINLHILMVLIIENRLLFIHFTSKTALPTIQSLLAICWDINWILTQRNLCYLWHHGNSPTKNCSKFEIQHVKNSISPLWLYFNCQYVEAKGFYLKIRIKKIQDNCSIMGKILD